MRIKFLFQGQNKVSVYNQECTKTRSKGISNKKKLKQRRKHSQKENKTKCVN